MRPSQRAEQEGAEGALAAEGARMEGLAGNPWGWAGPAARGPPRRLELCPVPRDGVLVGWGWGAAGTAVPRALAVCKRLAFVVGSKLLPTGGPPRWIAARPGHGQVS